MLERATSVSTLAPAPWVTAELSMSDFMRLSAYIEEKCGIRLPPIKRVMLESRLRKRLRTLNMTSFSVYTDYVMANESEELVYMINEVTTNKTDFFREPAHFTYLYKFALCDLYEHTGAGRVRDLRIWSAAASTGEDVYTLAMVLEEWKRHIPDFRYHLLGSDICTDVLERAARGIYSLDQIKPVRPDLRGRYLMRSKNRESPRVRITPELRSQVRFEQRNLLEPRPPREKFDVVFCRNVLIYFNTAVKQRVLDNLCAVIPPNGYLFMGHSETLNGFGLPLTQVAPTIYKKLT